MGELVKVRLLNSGSYAGMSDVEFPVVVSAEIERAGKKLLAYVPEREVNAIPLCEGWFCDYQDPRWPFVVGTECEIIND